MDTPYENRMPDRVIFACVNFNGAAYTERWITSVAGQSRPPGTTVSAVVVDNGSDLEDYRRVCGFAGKIPGVEVVRNAKNEGYFTGLNVALEHAEQDFDAYWVVGNNDLEFAEDFSSTLLSRRYEANVLVVAPNVVTADGIPQNPHSIGRLSRLRKAWQALYFSNYMVARALAPFRRLAGRVRGRYRSGQRQVARGIYMGIGACYVLCPEFRRRCGRLPTDVFMYGEEALLAGQVVGAGGETFFDDGLHVRHAEEGAVGLLPSRRVYEWNRASYPKYRKFL